MKQIFFCTENTRIDFSPSRHRGISLRCFWGHRRPSCLDFYAKAGEVGNWRPRIHHWITGSLRMVFHGDSPLENGLAHLLGLMMWILRYCLLICGIGSGIPRWFAMACHGKGQLQGWSRITHPVLAWRNGSISGPRPFHYGSWRLNSSKIAWLLMSHYPEMLAFQRYRRGKYLFSRQVEAKDLIK